LEASVSVTNIMNPAPLPLILLSVSSSEGPLGPIMKWYFPAGKTAFCQWTSWVSVKVPAASWAKARLGAKFRALKTKTAA